MKKFQMLAVLAASMVGMTACGTQNVANVAENAQATVEEAKDAVAAVESSVSDAAAAVEASVSDAVAAVEGSVSEAEAAVEGATEHVYMGGLYISEPDNDLMLAMYREPDGDLIGLVTKQGETWVGDFTTEDAKLEDGTEYSKMLIDGAEFGYHFDVEGDGAVAGGKLIDEDKKVYDAKPLDESVALEMIAANFVADEADAEGTSYFTKGVYSFAEDETGAIVDLFYVFEDEKSGHTVNTDGNGMNFKFEEEDGKLNFVFNDDEKNVDVFTVTSFDDGEVKGMFLEKIPMVFVRVSDDVEGFNAADFAGTSK